MINHHLKLLKIKHLESILPHLSIKSPNLKSDNPVYGVTTGLLWVALLSGIFAIGYTAYALYPYIFNGIASFEQYLNFTWAHEAQQVEVFLQLSVAVWAISTVLYFDGWLIHRSFRKLKGKAWRIVSDDNRKHFFPKIMPYMKWSCLFLAVVWLFVIVQYPLQYMILN